MRTTMPASGPGRSRPAPMAGEPPIPFELTAALRVRGVPGSTAEGVITVPADGTFVATGISYAMEESRREPLLLQGALAPPPLAVGGAGLPATTDARRVTLAQIPAWALLRGVRVRPERVPVLFQPDADGNYPADAPLLNSAVPTRLVLDAFEVAPEPGEIDFLISLVDSATGRELADQPVSSLASLGSADGRRPFRTFGAPIELPPRTTVRVQVIERTVGVSGVLHVVLQGHVRPRSHCVSEVGAVAGGAMAFDHVARFELAGTPGRAHVQELAIGADGMFVATAIGYGMIPSERGVAIMGRPGLPSPFALGAALLALPAPGAAVDLGALTLAQLPPSALRDGLRVKPAMSRLAFTPAGVLTPAAPAAVVDHLFERTNRAEGVRFRYLLSDANRSRELSNRPVFSLAGLGSADGIRPFKPLRPGLAMPAGSTLRVDIEEVEGRGELHVVFQGVKVRMGRSRP